LRGRVSAFPPPKDVRVSAEELINVDENVDSEEEEDFQESDDEEEWEDDWVSYSAKGSLKEPDWEMLTPQSRGIGA